MKGLLLSAIIGLTALTACSQKAEEITSFNECLFNRLPGVSSDAAAAMIRGACREMFPEEQFSPTNRFAKYANQR